MCRSAALVTTLTGRTTRKCRRPTAFSARHRWAGQDAGGRGKTQVGGARRRWAGQDAGGQGKTQVGGARRRWAGQDTGGRGKTQVGGARHG